MRRNDIICIATNKFSRRHREGVFAKAKQERLF